MADRTAAVRPILAKALPTSAWSRFVTTGAVALCWLIIFATAALLAAWFAGAWTPPDKPIPGASWFASTPDQPSK